MMRGISWERWGHITHGPRASRQRETVSQRSGCARHERRAAMTSMSFVFARTSAPMMSAFSRRHDSEYRVYRA